ncbi:hypothetical protein KAI12_04745 [Candidatus Bathyarchaeota archaeon]|nr:hypothetical protein [Candidatus Bathyarchaeota archaeon]
MNTKHASKSFSPSSGVKAWIVISLCSLLVWILYWLPSTFERYYNFIFVSWHYYGDRNWMYAIAGIGLIGRLVGVLLALASAYLLWGKAKNFFDVKNLVAASLSLESVYFLSLLPVPWLLITGGYQVFGSVSLAMTYLLQILLTAPFLAILAAKVKNYQSPNGFKDWKWAGIAFVGYTAALWVNSVFRWFDMVARDGVAVFFSGITGLGALNAFVLMSLAVVFAVVGAYLLGKQKQATALKWLGLSLATVGLHFLLHLVYSYYVGVLSYVWLVDIWTIPLLGLGISMLKTKLNAKPTLD